ncbi:transposase [bacterium]|nr:transposase [bacterium]
MQTNSDPSTGVIIKSDRSGRVRYTDEFKREVLAAYESSSLSGPDFARQCGIKYPTLAAWVAARRRGKQPGGAMSGPTFLVAEMASSAEQSALEMRFPGGAVARVSDAAQVRLLAVLLQHLS